MTSLQVYAADRPDRMGVMRVSIGHATSTCRKLAGGVSDRLIFTGDFSVTTTQGRSM